MAFALSVAITVSVSRDVDPHPAQYLDRHSDGDRPPPSGLFPTVRAVGYSTRFGSLRRNQDALWVLRINPDLEAFRVRLQGLYDPNLRMGAAVFPPVGVPLPRLCFSEDSNRLGRFCEVAPSSSSHVSPSFLPLLASKCPKLRRIYTTFFSICPIPKTCSSPHSVVS